MTPVSGLTIQRAPGRIVLSCRSLFSAESWQDSKALLERLLAIPAVALVRIDRVFGHAEVRFRENSTGAQQAASFLRQFADSLRAPSSTPQVHDSYRLCETFSVSKLNGQVVGGEVSWIRSGQTCVSHPLLRGNSSLGLVVKQMLAWEPQVQQVTFRAASGSLLIEHAPDFSTDQLLVSLERILGQIGDAAHADNSRRRLLISAGCVALAIPAEMMLPALVPVVAGALVIANLKTLGRGLQQLISFRWRLPALYTAIMGTTLISGQVLAAALMQASIAAWYCWSNRRLRLLVEKLLTSTGELAHTDSRLSVDARRLPAVNSVPTENNCLKNRRSITDKPFQESLLKSLARVGSNHRANERCHDQASRFIPWTFATGVAAIATTDITTLAAVLRPDFSTGPSISEQIMVVAVMSDLLRKGWLVSHPEAIARFVAAERIIQFDVDSGDETLEAESSDVVSEFGLRIRRQFWQLPDAKVSIDVEVVSGPAFSCAEYAQYVASTERDVVFCGPSELLNVIDDEWIVRVAMDSNDGNFSSVRADFFAVTPDRSLRDLFDTILTATQTTRNGWSIVMTLNFVSVIGAFIVGLTSLHVVALTNLGTWAAFAATSGQERHRLACEPTQPPTTSDAPADNPLSARNGSGANDSRQVRLPV